MVLSVCENKMRERKRGRREKEREGGERERERKFILYSRSLVMYFYVFIM